MKDERVVVSYALWLGAFMGLGGLHRLYNGKIGSGLLWLFTLGLFGVGQFVDLFLIPNMSEEYEMKLRLKMGVNPAGLPLNTSAYAPTQVVPAPPSEKLMLRILKAANERGGQISLTQAVMDTGADFEEVEEILKDMVKKGHAHVDNHLTKGTIIYEFPEL
ncbi:MAG: TM2 domain-containing protein [Jaaginema sp. PMC 1079.18]|nr:TM2 domain-containing protein [Jaaginema sp. PMC 1080.18]MEC4850558.1 TM2 domain-containing protein [Jaaginema sp. PMC 1079.18]MEC4865470.1 TM2 domain-containing protein [Jaaginema sp. PMC 1078.18]